MFKRKIYQDLLTWKNTQAGRYALLLEGARRVGKTTVVQEFASREYRSHILIDFSVAPASIIKLFDDISNLDQFFTRLQYEFGVDLFRRESVVVFDEVQLCPKARQAIKSLVKDGRYDYIETGSLISIKRNVEKILIPSEERRLRMSPMDFEEFVWAVNGEGSLSILRSAFEREQPMGDGPHRAWMREYRRYMAVGGMPQAVAEYLASNNLRMVDEVKRGILDLYENDFRKLDKSGATSVLFDAIPAQLNKNASRYQVSSVLSGQRAGHILDKISSLEDSCAVLLAHHIDNPEAGLAGSVDLGKFKMFLADTGLFTTLLFKEQLFTENEIYRKLMSDKLSLNLGYLYENAVAQTFAAKGYRLYYHTFMNESTRRNYEVDFILPMNDKVCPIEVKSSNYKTHASLDAFTRKFSRRIAERYLISTKDMQREGNLRMVPIYMSQFIGGF